MWELLDLANFVSAVRELKRSRKARQDLFQRLLAILALGSLLGIAIYVIVSVQSAP